MLTSSRTAILALVVGTGTFFFLKSNQEHKGVRSSRLLFYFFGLTVLSTLAVLALLRQGNTFNGRVGIWKNGIEAFKDSPIFGVGLANQGVENSYISELLQTGVIGILFLALIFVKVFNVLVKTVAKNQTLILVLSGYIIVESIAEQIFGSFRFGVAFCAFLFIVTLCGTVDQSAPLEKFNIAIKPQSILRSSLRN